MLHGTIIFPLPAQVCKLVPVSSVPFRQTLPNTVLRYLTSKRITYADNIKGHFSNSPKISHRFPKIFENYPDYPKFIRIFPIIFRNFYGFRKRNIFTGCGYWPHAQPSTWRARDFLSGFPSISRGFQPGLIPHLGESRN